MITHGKGEEEYCVDIVKDVMSISEWKEWYKINNIPIHIWGTKSNNGNHLMDVYTIEPLQFGIVKDFEGIVDNPSILM